MEKPPRIASYTTPFHAHTRTVGARRGVHASAAHRRASKPKLNLPRRVALSLSVGLLAQFGKVFRNLGKVVIEALSLWPSPVLG